MNATANVPGRNKWVVVLLLALQAAPWSIPVARPAEITVLSEDVVTRYAPANNGAGPLWCYGSPLIVRHGEQVFASVIETGAGVEPLCNTRWQLWRKQDAAAWEAVAVEKGFRQREPCPLVLLPEHGHVLLSANPSTQPPGTQYGECAPGVVVFDLNQPASPPLHEQPAWAEGTHFTDHSYRGFATDAARGECLLLHINARTSAQFVSFRDDAGQWHARGSIDFPIRAAYPQVALRGGGAHVLAIGDIQEPVAAWRALKAKHTGNSWDYVFRRLFYTWAPDIATRPFAPPVEVDTVEATGGHLTNLDIFVDARGDAHLLYLKHPHQHAFLRDSFFPDAPITTTLMVLTVRNGEIVSRRALLHWSEHAPSAGIRPGYARFHATAGERLLVVVSGSETVAGQSVRGNWILDPDSDATAASRIPLQHPFGTFFNNSPRGGSAPSDTIDLFGATDEAATLRHARVLWRDGSRE